MATQKHFTTINGQPVQLQYAQFAAAHNFKAQVNASETGVRVNEAGSGGKYYVIGQVDGVLYEADRMVIRKANPSNHKCDARCRHAKGHNCECSCGGKFHGAGD